MTLEEPDASGTNVWYSVSASDNRDPSASVSCTPAAGSFFSVGTTTVNCQATDSFGNTATGSFQVHVYALLQLGVSVASQGTASARDGTATVSGVVSCSRGLTVYVTGNVTQLFANRVSISGYISTAVACTAPSTPWTVTVSGSNGRFGAGSAKVSVDAFGCELSCHSTSATSNVRLVGTK
jgi:hypothetical protein